MADEMDEMMEGGEIKKLMYMTRTAPYGTVYALEALEVVLIGAAFEQDVCMVFADDGLFQLKKGQNTEATGMKNFSPTYRALEMYDVEKLYVEKESMDARGMTEDDFIVDVEVKTSDELTSMMEDMDIVLNF
ncbi:MAG: sulfurtransferase complex subunit TusC [Acidiferrobacterales bacterium]|jgi:tRNA 2-thiouridine synthesizing protein C|nr:sulfurtransferase complex subunit TusC [Acidiferrobacterales bacterium]